jgi:uncharacterized protein YcfL
MKVCFSSIVIFITIFLVVGCSSKKEKVFMSVVKEQAIASKQLQKTEKIQLYNTQEGITNVLLTSTYISKKQITVKKEKRKYDEIFIVGVYVDNNETENINIESFSLQINGKSPKSIKVLKENNRLLKEIPFVFPWTQFYLVHFPYSSSKRMRLSVDHAFYGEATVYFTKVAKYVLSKTAF